MTVEATIMQTTDSLKIFQKNFTSFYAYNYIFIIVAAAVCIGIATKDMVSGIMNESLLPIIDVFIAKSIPYFFYNKALEYSTKHQFIHLLIRKLGRMIWNILVWILILYATYIVFKTLSRVDLITGKVDFVQSLTRYVSGETPPTIQEERRRTTPIQNPANPYIFTNRY